MVEIQQRDRFSVHMDISVSVDSLLRGYPLPPEIRSRDSEGKIHVEKARIDSRARAESEFRIETGMTTGPRRPLRQPETTASNTSAGAFRPEPERSGAALQGAAQGSSSSQLDFNQPAEARRT